MVGFTVVSFAIIAVFVSMIRLGATLSYSSFRLMTSSLTVFIVGLSLTQPAMAALFVLPVLAARRMVRPLTHVPEWFSHPAGSDLARD